MQILAIRNFDAELFELNARRLLRAQSVSCMTILGDYGTFKQVPRTVPFEAWTIARPFQLAEIIKLWFRIWKRKFDMVYYGHSEPRGNKLTELAVDIFVATLPWREVAIAENLFFIKIKSRGAFLVYLARRIFHIFLPYNKNKKTGSRASFLDELLLPDRPVGFEWVQKPRSVFKRTILDETRTCFEISQAEALEVLVSESDVAKISVGIAPKDNKGEERVGDVSITLKKGSKIVSEIKQPCETFLPSWNDHFFEPAEESALTVPEYEKASYSLQFRTSAPSAHLSFPTFLKQSKRKNVVVVILDGVDQNSLGLCNPESKATPHIDEFFSRGINYANAYSQEIWTRPTFASMVTSYYPSHHQFCDKNFFLEIPEGLPNLARDVRGAGYHTSAYVSHRLANQLYGFSKGFDRFIWRQTGQRSNHDARDITYFALETLEQNKDANHFLFLHYFDTHLPFFPKSPYCYYDRKSDFRNAHKTYLSGKKKGIFSEEDRNLITISAKNKMFEMDTVLAPLLEKLNKRQFRETTSVILTSDHGFGSMEGDFLIDNGTFRLTENAIKVPLFVSPAESLNILVHVDTEKRLVEASVDLYPSVMDLVGAVGNPSPYAVSYIPNEQGEVPEKSIAVSEAIYFDEYQLLIRNLNEYYYMRCKKDLGCFNIFSESKDEEKIIDLKTGNIISGQYADRSLEQFKSFRKQLRLAEFYEGHAQTALSLQQQSERGFSWKKEVLT